MIRRIAVIGVLSTVVVVLGATACSSDSGAGGQTSPPSPTSSPYSLKIYSYTGGQQTLMKFGPIETPARSAAGTADASTSTGSAIHAANENSGGGSGSTIFNGPAQLFPPADAQTVVVAAAAQCGMVGDTSGSVKTVVYGDEATYSELYQQYQNHQTIMSEQALNTPWSTIQSPFPAEPWYIFPSPPNSCDQVLEYEEVLLCVADKLSQLADAISPITWPNAGFVTGSAPTASPWVIPPQSEQDKFIARDTAVDVLSHIAWLDSYPFSAPAGVVGWPGNSCSALYAAYDTTPAGPLQTAIADVLSPNANPAYPPNSTGPLGNARLAFETNTLRAAGQLLHDLVREGVYSDLAGAASQAESQGDPKGGQALAWGWKSTTPYNSIGHAARLLTGRWELTDIEGGGENDPQCMGTAEENLISLADPGTKARANVTAPTTVTAATAASLFEESGIVVADGATVDLRSALTTQLNGARGQAQGISPDQFASSSGGMALANVIATLSDADLANAAVRTRASFALLTGTSTANAAAMPTSAGKVLATVSTVANAALGTSGIAVAGGLPSGTTSADPNARAGAMMAASQCYEDLGVAQLLFDEDSLAPIAATPSSAQATAERWMRQDVFAIGQSLRSRLVKMRQLEDSSMPTGPGSPPDAVARAAAIAELGAWAGSARAILRPALNADPYYAVTLDLEGIDPTTFGTTDPTALVNIIRLVAGDPVLAECAAALPNSSCDPTSLTTETWIPASIQVLDGGTSGASAGQMTRYGTTSYDVRLEFDVYSGPPEYQGYHVAPQAFSNTPLYLVANSYTGKPTGVGAVLGALRIPLPAPGQSGSSAVQAVAGALTLSPMRDELLYDALGLGAWVGAAPPQAGALSMASSPQYCIDGIPRDVFVPLENDLTNDSNSYENSWQHYLSLAADAANRADSIGQDWINVGFNQTTTDEQAGEQLIAQNGSAVNVSDIGVDQNGNLTAGASNGALNTVLSQPMIDLVFFGADPLNGIAAGGQQGAIQNIVCNPPSAHAICSRIATATAFVKVDPSTANAFKGDATPTTISYTALNVVSASPPTSGQGWTATCGPLTQSIQDLRRPNGAFSGSTFGQAFGPTSSGQWSPDPLNLAGEVANVKMNVTNGGAWTVVYGGTTLMDSDNPPSWPACLSASTCDWTNTLITNLNAMFRRCPTGGLQGVLGSCEGDGTNPDSELNAIRWRVEGTLWLLASMTGGLADGMFTSPMPAVNASGSTQGASIAAFFENGQFDMTTTPPSIPANFGPALGNEVALGSPVAIDQRFTHWGSDVADVLPLWLRRIYANGNLSPSQLGDYATSYVHVTGTSGSTPSGPTNLTQSGVTTFFGSTFNQRGLPSGYLQSNSWQAIGNALDGQSCAAPAGNFGPIASFPSIGNGGFQGLMATIKTSQDLSSPMASADEVGIPIRASSPWARRGVWSTMLNQFISTFYRFQAPAGRSFTPQSLWFDEAPVYAFDLGINGGAGNVDEFYASNEWYPASRTAAPAPEQVPSGLFSIQEPYAVQGAWNYTFRSASTLAPENRLRRALNSGAPNGDCGAAWEFTQAVALACMLDQNAQLGATVITSPPQNLETSGDLASLTAWLGVAMNQAALGVSEGFVQSIPANVVAGYSSPSGTNTGVGGAYGEASQSLLTAILDVPYQWNLVANDGAQLNDDISQAATAIDLVNKSTDEMYKQTLIEKLNTENNIAQSVAAAVSSWAQVLGPNANPVAAGVAATTQSAASVIEIVNDGEIMSALHAIDSDIGEEQGDQIRAALTTLSAQASTTATDLNNAIISIRKDVAAINGAQAALQSARNATAYYAGKAAGLGVWNCGSSSAPVECTSHTNTVLNREYAGYELRYEAALASAKGLAYIARLAIEQRIGERLTDITTPIGPLDPPSTWADDVCSLTGINYQQLEQQDGLDAGTTAQLNAVDQQIAGQFANAFIGDYVQKFSDFVEYYNVTYPERKTPTEPPCCRFART